MVDSRTMAGFSLSFERNVLRRYLVPLYGLEVGGLVHDERGSRFHATPYLCFEFYSDPYFSIVARGAYRLVPSEMSSLTGPQGAVGAFFSWW